MEDLFLAMEPLMAGQEWGTAVRGLLGKFEYVVAAQAAFIQMQENAFSRVTSAYISDNALKCALRFLDLRMALGACVVDAEAEQAPARSACVARHSSDSQAHASADTVGRMLRCVLEEPITFSSLSCHMTHLRSDKTGEKRLALLQEAADLGLGSLETAPAHGLASRSLQVTPVRLRRSLLTESVAQMLQSLRVPAGVWPKPALAPDLATAPDSESALVHLRGTGKQGSQAKPKSAGKKVLQLRGKPRKVAEKKAAKAKAEPVARVEIQLCAPISCQRPPSSSADVEVLLSHALCHKKVHEQTWAVKATDRKKKRRQTWQLRCTSCQHGTCQWTGQAWYDSETKSVCATAIEGREHGRPKVAAKAGRKTKELSKRLEVQESLHFESDVSQEALHKAVQSHFADKGSSLLVRCKPRKSTRAGLTCVFYCNTHCNKDTGKLCNWSGAANLAFATATKPAKLALRYEAATQHAPDERELYGRMTWRQRLCVLRTKTTDTKLVMGEVSALRKAGQPEKDLTPPSKSQLEAHMVRYRKSLRAHSSDEGAVTAGRLDVSDFHFLQDKLNADLGGASHLTPDDGRLQPTDPSLRVVGMSISREHVVVPLICPSLVQQVCSLLEVPSNIKLSLDGTYRLLLGTDYALLNVGVNVKHWATGSAGFPSTCRSKYVPLGFAIASVKSEECYARLVDCVLAVCQRFQPSVSAASVRQWHGDMHPGLDLARQRLAAHAARLSDWAHVTGTTSPGPAGFPGLARRYFHQGDAQLSWLLSWFGLSRFLPAALFHVIWSSVWQRLGANHPVLRPLQRHYFVLSHGQWDAAWRAGPDRICFGTAVGSAPQESWHGTTLKRLVAGRASAPVDLARQLEVVVRHELQSCKSLAKSSRRLMDCPGAGQHLDQQLLTQSWPHFCPKLVGVAPQTSSGPTLSATLGFLFRLPAILATQACPLMSGARPLSVQLPPQSARFFATLCTSSSVPAVQEALQRLAIFDTRRQEVSDWGRAFRVLDDWRCVVLGPAVAEYWAQQHRPLPEPGLRNKHMRSLCFLCPSAAKWGPCEHAYCAMLGEGLLSVESVSGLSGPKRGRPKKAARHPAGLALAREPDILRLPSSVAPASRCVTQPSALPVSSAEAQSLSAVLRAAGLASLQERFTSQDATVAILQTLICMFMASQQVAQEQSALTHAHTCIRGA